MTYLLVALLSVLLLAVVLLYGDRYGLLPASIPEWGFMFVVGAGIAGVPTSLVVSDVERVVVFGYGLLCFYLGRVTVHREADG